MTFIKRISAEEMNSGLKKFYKTATVEEFWEVKGLYAQNGDYCYATVDDNCFYFMQKDTNLFVYFAIDKGKFTNIKGLFECFYDLICEGYPFLRINGIKGRYPKLFRAFSNFISVETTIKENEEFIWYAGHPDNVEKIKRRFQ